jgi:hypothetical protein
MVSVASTYVPPDASGASVLPFAPWSARRSASARAARRQRAEGFRDEAPRERDATMAVRATETVRGRGGGVPRARETSGRGMRDANETASTTRAVLPNANRHSRTTKGRFEC